MHAASPSPSRAERAPDGTSAQTACFTVTAAAEPGLLPRLLAPIVKRGLTPGRLHAAQGPDGFEMTVDLQVPGLDAGAAAHIGAQFETLVGVTGVLVSAKRDGRRIGLAA